MDTTYGKGLLEVQRFIYNDLGDHPQMRTMKSLMVMLETLDPVLRESFYLGLGLDPERAKRYSTQAGMQDYDQEVHQYLTRDPSEVKPRDTPEDYLELWLDENHE